MTTKIGREAVLDALKDRAPRAAHLMEVVGALELDKTRKNEVRDLLDELTDLGMAREMPGNRFRLSKKKSQPSKPSGDAARGGGDSPRRRRGEPSSRGTGGRGRGGRDRDRDRDEPAGDVIAGWLSVHPRGFGFVAVEDGGPDVFVPGSAMGPALHGDRVEVRAKPSSKGRDGEVVGVVRRGVKRIAGVLQKRRKDAWLETSDARLPERVEVSGTIPLGIEVGEEVVALIEKWPDGHGEPMVARVLSSLGAKGSAAVEIEKIKIREGIEEEFEDDVLAEAQTFGTRVPKDEVERREDLRDLDLLTIDPPTARDHDDAVWAERLKGGSFRVIVAIADVSYYVRAGGALDEAALERATSIYLPDRVIPMLPHELSSNLASLVPDEDRLTLAVECEVGPRGAIKKRRFIEGVMRSRDRLSYGGVARALGLTDKPDKQPGAESRKELLGTLWDVSQILRKKRQRRGGLEFDLPEAEIQLGDDGEPSDIVRSRTDPGLRKAYGLIEDLALLANEVVAEELDRRGIPAIYRIHGNPNEERVAVFAEVAESLGHPLGDDAGSDPKALARFLGKVEGTEHAQALSFLLLRAMQQATYDTTNIGHFALAAKYYLHFTSPIRRYPDLAVHRIVRALARGERIDKKKLAETLVKQAATSSRLERRAMNVDREATNLYRAILMKDRVGEEFDARITGVAEHGVYVAFDEPFVEARVPIDTLGQDWYELDKHGLRLVGSRSGHSFGLGDRLRVRLEDVSIESRELRTVIVAQVDADGEHQGEPDSARRDSKHRAGGRDQGRGPKRRGSKNESRRGSSGDSPRSSKSEGVSKSESRRSSKGEKNRTPGGRKPKKPTENKKRAPKRDQEKRDDGRRDLTGTSPRKKQRTRTKKR